MEQLLPDAGIIGKLTQIMPSSLLMHCSVAPWVLICVVCWKRTPECALWVSRNQLAG
jgi:hypothetical protein